MRRTGDGSVARGVDDKVLEAEHAEQSDLKRMWYGIKRKETDQAGNIHRSMRGM